MNKEMICIECPRGCTLSVTLDGGRVAAVEGNLCPRGKAYATSECEEPRRVLTATVRASDGRLLPVRTSGPVKREEMMAIMTRLKTVVAKLPVSLGDVIVERIDGEYDLLASRSMEEGK